jgi:hypothetical protein
LRWWKTENVQEDATEAGNFLSSMTSLWMEGEEEMLLDLIKTESLGQVFVEILRKIDNKTCPTLADHDDFKSEQPTPMTLFANYVPQMVEVLATISREDLQSLQLASPTVQYILQPFNTPAAATLLNSLCSLLKMIINASYCCQLSFLAAADPQSPSIVTSRHASHIPLGTFRPNPMTSTQTSCTSRTTR